jgi:archaeal cell division control protein 6
MGIFDNILKDDESLFKNEFALAYDFVPKEIPHRENQQHYIADCITPLLKNRNGKNLFVFGAPGIGKTVAIKHIFRELEEKTNDVIPIYVNCWKKDTSYKILIDICFQLGYKWTHNKRTDELLKVVSDIINKKSAVICLDEIDRVKDVDILYSLSEDILKKTLIVIANDPDWIIGLDQRIKSRLMPEPLEFKQYTFDETKDIINQRIKSSFFDNVWSADSIEGVVSKTFELKDIRAGLFLLKESGNIAERKASKKINLEFVKLAVSKLVDFKIKDSKEFGDDEREILKFIKENSGKTIKSLYDLFEGDMSYRTFHRKILDLKNNNMVNFGEKKSKSLIVNYSKKLTEF